MFRAGRSVSAVDMCNNVLKLPDKIEPTGSGAGLYRGKDNNN